ncbi:MAG: hypothetical protein WC705_03335 [Candidatus Paceibacterota bacterium]|jgi:hypothetical protein
MLAVAFIATVSVIFSVNTGNTEVTGATATTMTAATNDSGNTGFDSATTTMDKVRVKSVNTLTIVANEFPFATTSEARSANQGSAAYANYCALTATNFDGNPLQLAAYVDATAEQTPWTNEATNTARIEVVDLHRNETRPTSEFNFTYAMVNDLRRNAAANPILRA